MGAENDRERDAGRRDRDAVDIPAAAATRASGAAAIPPPPARPRAAPDLRPRSARRRGCGRRGAASGACRSPVRARRATSAPASAGAPAPTATTVSVPAAIAVTPWRRHGAAVGPAGGGESSNGAWGRSSHARRTNDCGPARQPRSCVTGQPRGLVFGKLVGGDHRANWIWVGLPWAAMLSSSRRPRRSAISFLGPWRSGAVAMSRLRAGRCGRGRGCDQRCAACWALRARRSSTPSGHPDRARTPRDAAGDVPEYRSDADPTEDLAGVVAAKAGAFQCLRSRGRDAVAEQASVPTGRVDMDRPSPTSMLAQHTPAIVKRGGEIDWCDGRHARCRPVIVAVMPHLFSIIHVPQLPARLRGEGPAPSITRQRSPAGCTDSGVTEASSCHLGQGWTQRTPLIVASSSSARFVDVQGVVE